MKKEGTGKKVKKRKENAFKWDDYFQGKYIYGICI